MARVTSWREAADGLRRDLEGIVGPRLQALLVYEAHGLLGDLLASSETTTDADLRHEDLVHTLAVVDNFGIEDLTRLAKLAPTWEKRHLAVPLFLDPRELSRSLDAFPLELSQILAHHVVIAGADPFTGLSVNHNDLRRACETQVKSHLLHLREGFLQAGGDTRKVAALVGASAVPLRALLVNIARLHDVHARSADALLHFLQERLTLTVEGLRPVVKLPLAKGTRGPEVAGLFQGYLQAVEHLARLVDEWTL
jgi:hypothetical protein